MTTFLTILVLVGLCWIVALEVRFHTLKNATANSEELAQEAIDEAEALLAKVRAELQTEKAAKRPAPKRKS